MNHAQEQEEHIWRKKCYSFSAYKTKRWENLDHSSFFSRFDNQMMHILKTVMYCIFAGQILICNDLVYFPCCLKVRIRTPVLELCLPNSAFPPYCLGKKKVPLSPSMKKWSVGQTRKLPWGPKEREPAVPQA